MKKTHNVFQRTNEPIVVFLQQGERVEIVQKLENALTPVTCHASFIKAFLVSLTLGELYRCKLNIYICIHTHITLLYFVTLT